MEHKFYNIPVEKNYIKPLTLDEKLEQLWDEYADEMGYERKGDYVIKRERDGHKFRAKLTKEAKEQIKSKTNSEFKSVELEWEII
jgi:hypothetical protein